MIKPGRIPCLNPRCGRTADARKYPDCTEIVCGKCWRGLPQALRNEYRMLTRREKRILRRIAYRDTMGRPVPRRIVLRLQEQFRRRQNDLWDRIRRRFLAPDRPEGLDAFLEEIGLAESPAPDAG